MTIDEKLKEFEEFAARSIYTYPRECLAMLRKAIEQRDGLSNDISEENQTWRINYMNAELLKAGEG